jgi:hypothetical protein
VNDRLSNVSNMHFKNYGRLRMKFFFVLPVSVVDLTESESERIRKFWPNPNTKKSLDSDSNVDTAVK